MTQATVEKGIVDTITKQGDFRDTNCFLYDKRSLAKGLNRICIVSYNTHRRQEITLQLERRTWTYNIDVLVPWRGELTELDTRIGIETQKIIDILAKYPRLDGVSGVQKTIMNVSNTPDLLRARRGAYRGRRHLLDVLEIFDPGRAE